MGKSPRPPQRIEADRLPPNIPVVVRTGRRNCAVRPILAIAILQLQSFMFHYQDDCPYSGMVGETEWQYSYTILKLELGLTVALKSSGKIHMNT